MAQGAGQALALRAVSVAVAADKPPAVATLKRGRATGLDGRHNSSLDPGELRSGGVAYEGAADRAGFGYREWCWSRSGRSAPWCSQVRLFERDTVQETKSVDGLVQRRPGYPTSNQMNLEISYIRPDPACQASGQRSG